MLNLAALLCVGVVVVGIALAVSATDIGAGMASSLFESKKLSGMYWHALEQRQAWVRPPGFQPAQAATESQWSPGLSPKINLPQRQPPEPASARRKLAPASPPSRAPVVRPTQPSWAMPSAPAPAIPAFQTPGYQIAELFAAAARRVPQPLTAGGAAVSSTGKVVVGVEAGGVSSRYPARPKPGARPRAHSK